MDKKNLTIDKKCLEKVNKSASVWESMTYEAKKLKNIPEIRIFLKVRGVTNFKYMPKS